MVKRFSIALVIWIAAGWAQAAAPKGDFDRLFHAMGLVELMEIMSQEGIDAGNDLANDMFGGPSEGWSALLEQIYDPQRMEARMRDGMARELKGADLETVLAFYTTKPGQTIVSLEVAARRAQLDKAVAEASRQTLGDLSAAQQARMGLLERFVAANDLIEENVVSALNANYAFYLGLKDAETPMGDLPQEELLAQVWAQEQDIRSETEEWLFAYLLLAYEPLEDADLEAYIAVSETPAGQNLNRALFRAFDKLFVEQSRALGRAVGSISAGEDI